jgi:ribonucleoside-diphosphate reductase alpha chain
MRRVMEKGEWTLFSPSSVPDLHDKFGIEFEQAYVRYEEKASAGEIKPAKTVPAADLWRKMLTMLFETGHPWITFKDPCNIRSPQQHVGVVHSSNLCTEITLNTNDAEIAVCNLGSVNLPAHMKNGQLDHAKLQQTIRTAMRMLDNVIDINYYAVKKARDSNMRHRPVGLGIMGFQDCLHMMRVPYASNAAVEFADRSMEAVCYYAYYASTELGGRAWPLQHLPGLVVGPWHPAAGLAEAPGRRARRLPRSRAVRPGLERAARPHRPAACATPTASRSRPTATISNIIGVAACIEPTFPEPVREVQPVWASSPCQRLPGARPEAARACGTSDGRDLKYFDGSAVAASTASRRLRALYATAFEVEPTWLVEARRVARSGSTRRSRSTSTWPAPRARSCTRPTSSRGLRGLKTTYYLRTQGATHAEKSTTDRVDQLNAVSAEGAAGGGFSYGAASTARVAAPAPTEDPIAPKFCALDDPECEACQ